MSLVLGLEHSCPWPREGLSSEKLSLALDFFCVLGLGLEPCLLDSTTATYRTVLPFFLVGLLSGMRLYLQPSNKNLCATIGYDLDWNAEVESRTQGSRPRTQKKKSEAKDRNARVQGQGSRIQTQVFSEKKRSSKIFFRRFPKKTV